MSYGVHVWRYRKCPALPRVRSQVRRESISSTTDAQRIPVDGRVPQVFTPPPVLSLSKWSTFLTQYSNVEIVQAIRYSSESAQCASDILCIPTAVAATFGSSILMIHSNFQIHVPLSCPVLGLALLHSPYVHQTLLGCHFSFAQNDMKLVDFERHNSCKRILCPWNLGYSVRT